MRSKSDRSLRPRRRAVAGTLALVAFAAVLAATLSPPGTATAAARKVAAQKSPSAAPMPALKALTASALKKTELFDLPTEEWFDPPPAPPPGGPPIPMVVRYGEGNTVRVGDDGRRQKVRLRSYDGGLVGPTFRLKPGDRLGVDLINQLPKEGEQPCQEEPGMTMNMEHMGLNTTNLHTHGLHISPSGSSDNVLREVRPGCTFKYQFQILPAGNPPGEAPMAHYPGTFWYHAHVHGSTAVQLASGMAGAMLVTGDVDRIPEIAAAHERIFVFQQLAFDNDGEVKSLDDVDLNWAGDSPGDPPKHGPKKHTTINGRVKPLIELSPGEVERWRFIDAGIFEELTLSLRNQAQPSEGLTFHEIALDGITRKAVTPLSEVELGPGYRADVLIQAPRTPGATYVLYKRRPKFQLTALTLKAESHPQVDQPEILAVVKVVDRVCSPPTCSTRLLPEGTRLPAPLRDITARDVTPGPTVVFSVKAGKLLINGKTFDPNAVLPEFQLTKGKVEEWVLENTSSFPHPFHIHVNAFQMVGADGTPGEWRDTIILPAKSKLKMRTRLERFTGRFVLHCHILTHEDEGMMQLVDIK